MKLEQPQPAAPGTRRTWESSHPAGPLPPQPRWADKTPDPLESLRDAHPIMQLFLEYRRLDASAPRSAPRELYERIKRGESARG